MFFASFLYFHVRVLCMYHILSYLIYFHITYLILSYTFIYILILFIYGNFVCFHLVLFMYSTFICFHTYNLHILMQSYTFLSDHCFISGRLYFSSCSCQHILVTVYIYYHIAMLCFYYHVMYFYPFRIMCIYLSFVLCFMPA